ncbi:MAG: hypothetical protein AUK63_1751 [bacterium P3]|nr:MAG: hypothetical protein AUK63_1751 [bacterium P3]KWW38688.1 MAG: hypothetical protein F083_2199 [bacterium F083]
MSEFTYEWPNAEDFYAGVRAVVQSQYSYEKELCSLVDIGHCDFYDTTDFSRNRWNAYYAEVHFFIPIDAYSKYGGMLDKYQNLLLGVCQKVMPPETGYDIMKVTISPILSSEAKKNTLTEIKKVVEESAYLNINDDLIEKGKKMADAYVTLYALENFVRQYIDKKLTEKIGPNYMNNVSLPQKIKSGIETRKTQEQGKKWLPLRGDNDLYYMDFIELSDFISSNWDYFKDDIKDQNWIKVKMEEMYNIRCLIAHNSYISDDNIQLLEVTTKQILAQLS